MEKTKKISGFTVLEMLIVTFIIGVMSTVLIVNWRKNEKTYLVRRTAQEMAQNIRKAQGLALTGKKISGQIVPVSYGVFFNKYINNAYKIYGDKNNDKKYQDSDILVEEIKLDSQVQIDSLSSGQRDLNIVFSIPDGFTRFDPLDVSATIVIKKVGVTCPSTSCRTITVRDTGQISVY